MTRHYPLILLSTWLRFFKVQSVDFLRPGVAHQQRRSVWSKPHPSPERQNDAAEVLEARHCFQFVVGDTNAVDGGIGVGLRIEINVLTVVGPPNGIYVLLRQLGPFLRGDIIDHQLLAVDWGSGNIAAVGRKSRTDRGFAT